MSNIIYLTIEFIVCVNVINFIVGATQYEHQNDFVHQNSINLQRKCDNRLFPK